MPGDNQPADDNAPPTLSARVTRTAQESVHRAATGLANDVAEGVHRAMTGLADDVAEMIRRTVTRLADVVAESVRGVLADLAGAARPADNDAETEA